MKKLLPMFGLKWLVGGAIGLLLLLLPAVGDRAPEASAQPAEGTLLSDLVVSNSAGLGVGFDGKYLYWLDIYGLDILHKITTAGDFEADIPIVGCTATVISWDASRNVFWGAATNGQISQITTGGSCTPWFSAAPACNEPIDGISYDPYDGTIWCSTDASVVVHHFTTPAAPVAPGGTGPGVPAPFPSFRVDTPPNDMKPECGFNFNSCIATGVDPRAIYLAADGCNTIFRYDKQTGAKLASFVIGGARHEDMVR